MIFVDRPLATLRRQSRGSYPLLPPIGFLIPQDHSPLVLPMGCKLPHSLPIASRAATGGHPRPVQCPQDRSS
jgi:hypothetical protein